MFSKTIFVIPKYHEIRDIITRNVKLLPKHSYTRISKMTNEFASLPSFNATYNFPNGTEHRSVKEDAHIANQVGLGKNTFEEIMKKTLESFEEKLKKTFKALEEDLVKNLDKTDVRYEERFNLQQNLIDGIIEDTYCDNDNLNTPKKTIIIVPYRDRADNLKLFISPIHKHLLDQVMLRDVYHIQNKKSVNINFT